MNADNTTMFCNFDNNCNEKIINAEFDNDNDNDNEIDLFRHQ